MQAFSFALLAFTAATAVVAQKGTFNLLTYDIANLPNGVRLNLGKNNPQIAAQASRFQIVNIQDDFISHDILYAADQAHPFRTTQSTSGLNTLSKLEFDSFRRIRWTSCNGNECNVPKGFTFKRVKVDQSGIFIDVYNLDAYDFQEPQTLQANIEQLSNFITLNSVGNPVIVAGATNSLYTSQNVNIRRLLEANQLTDAWVKLTRNGNLPDVGSQPQGCGADPTPECEVSDKILYRGTPRLDLKATAYQNAFKDFRDGNGANLSERFPVTADFEFEVIPDFKKSDIKEGGDGVEFNDFPSFPAVSSGIQVTSIGLRGNKRVDQVSITSTQGNGGGSKTFTHGGNGGNANSKNLAPGEHIISATVSYGDRDRLAFVELVTDGSADNKISAGKPDNDSRIEYKADPGFQIVGFHGRSGKEVDRLGVIFARI